MKSLEFRIPQNMANATNLEVYANCKMENMIAMLKSTFTIYNRDAVYQICNQYPIKSIESVFIDQKKCDYTIQNKTVKLKSCWTESSITNTFTLQNLEHIDNYKKLELFGQCNNTAVKESFDVKQNTTFDLCANKTLTINAVRAISMNQSTEHCHYKSELVGNKRTITVTDCVPTKSSASLLNFWMVWLLLINIC